MTVKQLTDPLPVVIPTEAESRAFDLESQEAAAGPDDAGPAPGQQHEDEIRRSAYERYLRRGGAAGSEVEDWLEAERAFDQNQRKTGQAG